MALSALASYSYYRRFTMGSDELSFSPGQQGVSKTSHWYLCYRRSELLPSRPRLLQKCLFKYNDFRQSIWNKKQKTLFLGGRSRFFVFFCFGAGKTEEESGENGRYLLFKNGEGGEGFRGGRQGGAHRGWEGVEGRGGVIFFFGVEMSTKLHLARKRSAQKYFY